MTEFEPFACPNCRHKFVPIVDTEDDDTEFDIEKRTVGPKEIDSPPPLPPLPILDFSEWETVKSFLEKENHAIEKSLSDSEFSAINKLFDQVTVYRDLRAFSNPETRTPDGWSNVGIKIESPVIDAKKYVTKKVKELKT